MSRAANFVVEQIFSLTPEQGRAASLRGKDVIVTAGAGSGKTRTLVARYLGLLVDGLSPRQAAAITFTEKAAREMRNRVRKELSRQKEQAVPEERAFWAGLETQMDSARIGTIHSLCAEILRSHPIEAGITPEFNVLDEGAAAALRAQVVQDTLAGLASQPALQPLFAAFEISTLEGLLSFALARRLDLHDWQRSAGGLPGVQAIVSEAVDRFTRSEPSVGVITELREMQAAGTLLVDAGDKLAEQIASLLETWDELEAAWAAGRLLEALEKLNSLRKSMLLNRGKASSRAKEALRALRDEYSLRVEPWLKDAPDPGVETLVERVSPLVERMFAQIMSSYSARLAALGALDFDDLEGGAERLLQNEAVCARWQQEIQALLVDEFQDTNPRQRAIIEAVCGPQPGRLFVVGDGRQSIYRFRGADVTVFSAMGAHIAARGGEKIDLDLTFRAHAPLVQATGDLLEPAMRCAEASPPEYWIEFSPLQAHRPACRPNSLPAHIELVAGCGEGAAAGRISASRALAQRLLELRAAGEIGGWQEVALLFRASTSFPYYEAALEGAGIPYVTLAGRGFYDRPEIRDVLNLLRAVADPWDDLALAGLLRSPAFGLTDSALYRLRCAPDGGSPRPFWPALSGSLDALTEPEKAQARRARAFLARFIPLADRLPVGVLLKEMVDATDYRSILAAVGSRLWRNLDKLLEDARQSGLVQVRDFLEYLETLRDVGAREGEADIEAEGSVQLMTVHKAKGLEFPVVVLADASYRPRSRSEKAYLFPKIGLAFQPDQVETAPLAYRILKALDQDQELAEDRRLLYVAATRAQEKLIVSGHISGNRVEGWLKLAAEAAGVQLTQIAEQPGTWQTVELPGGQTLGVYVAPPEENQAVEGSPGRAAAQEAPALLPDRHLPAGTPLYLPLVLAPEAEPNQEVGGNGNTPLPEPTWRATASGRSPAVLVGSMVHQALKRWLFPGEPGLDRLLETLAFNAGLLEETARLEALNETRRLLQRLRLHPFCAEIEAALERHHELPYARMRQGKTDSGYINLLYRTESGWVLVDFKTDTLRSELELQSAIDGYQEQVERYTQATRSLLGIQPQVVLCFLDFAGGVHVQRGV